MTSEDIQKIEQFTKQALAEIRSLRAQIIQQEKQASDSAQLKAEALQKAAAAMYEADFLHTSQEREAFVKRAQEDPMFLAKALEKVCAAADVSSLGKQANVAAVSQFGDCPIAQLAFGVSSGLMDI